jgi:hypothetical protein
MGSESGVDFEFTSVLVGADKKMYLILVAVNPQHYDELSPTIDRIFESFKLTEKGN